MIRQPDFVDKPFFEKMLVLTRQNKPIPLLDKVKFESLNEGDCVQMMHLGTYDDEPATFAKMEDWALENGWKRLSKIHREIYLADPRKTDPEKLKTVLRFQVGKV